jgi:hypothetical protein
MVGGLYVAVEARRLSMCKSGGPQRCARWGSGVDCRTGASRGRRGFRDEISGTLHERVDCERCQMKRCDCKRDMGGGSECEEGVAVAPNIE